MKTIQNKKEGETIVMRIEEDIIYFLCSWMKAADIPENRRLSEVRRDPLDFISR